MIDSKKIIVSLDGITEIQALEVAQRLNGKVWGFKINDLVYESLDLIENLKKYGRIFIDVKLHDIPNTVANSIQRLSRHRADIITVHASGGIEMMKAAKSHAGNSKILAVTVLTSEKTGDVGIVVKKLAEEALEAGVDGIVCSGHELEIIKDIPGINSKIKVVPGIRPDWYHKKDDQVRTMTPYEAIERNADYVVIGRPITQDKDPIHALTRIMSE